MSKVSILKKDLRKTKNLSSNGKNSEELKETKMMKKEQLKNTDMFFDKNIENLKKDIKDKMASFSSDVNTLFSLLDTTSSELQKTPNTSSFKQAAITISNVAFSFFTRSEELFNSIENLYEKNKELLNEKEQKQLKAMLKSLSMIISISTSFYKASTKMIGKIDLDSQKYEEFENNLFTLLDICKTVQARIASNLSSYKPEKLKIEFISGEKNNLFFENLRDMDTLKNRYKVSNISFYKSLKGISSTIRDEKRKNDDEKNKQIVKVNI